MGDPFRVAVAGLGFGARVHVPALLGIEGVEVVALVGRDLERTRTVAAEAGIERACARVEDVLDDVDALHIAVPPAEAPPMALEALDRGVAVLCEKPLAARLEDASAMTAAAAGRTTAVGFEMRELVTFAALRRELRTTRVHHVAIDWHARSWDLLEKRWSWKVDAVEGGGVLNLLGTHLVDLLEDVVAPIRTIKATSAAPLAGAFSPEGRTAAADTVVLHGELQTGATWVASVTNAATAHAHRWTVVADAATYEATNDGADWMSGFRLTRHDVGSTTELAREPDASGDGRVRPYRELATRFVSAARAGQPVRPSFDDGLRAQALLAGALG